MCYATPAEPKIVIDDKIIQRYSIQQIFAKISLYTTLTQLDFQYIRRIWFQNSTPAQLEIFVDDMIIHYTRTT